MPLKVGDKVEYRSRSHHRWVPTEVTVVHGDGTVEVACKPGARLDRHSVRRPPGVLTLAEAPVVRKRFSQGQDVEYYSNSHGRWVPCVVEQVRDDGAVQISAKKGAWIEGTDAATKVRPVAGGGGGGGASQAPSGGYASEPDDDPEWEIQEKQGFLSGGAEDQVESAEKAKAIVMSDPDTYMGFTCPVGAPGAYVRKQGSSFVQIASWKSYMLACKPLNYSGKLFEDPYSTNKSRFTGGLENGKGNSNQACWRRPGRGEGLLDRPNLCLFKSIEPNDLKQGNVGDCSLIAAIACLCEFKGAVRKLFKKHYLSRSGSYEVSLWDWGRKDWVVRKIDDRFATANKDSPTPLFAQASEDNEIFPMLIEKAVAIMAGGFDFMSSIMPPWALGVLTGCPDVWIFNARGGQWTGYRPVYDGTSTYEHKGTVTEKAWPDGSSGNTPKSNAEMWQALQYWDDHHYLTCCGSAAAGKSDASSLPCGIIYMHAYSVITVKSNLPGGINLLKCRNPHGAGGQEPNLPWKDNAPEWRQHPKVVEALTRDNHFEEGHEPDGLFWIRDRDFFGPSSNHFNTIYVVRCRMQPRDYKRRGLA